VAPRYGGPSTVVIQIVSALNRLPSTHAEIATTDADGQRGRISPKDIPQGLPVHIFRRDWSEQWKLSLDLRRWLSGNLGNYDVIHIHALWSYAVTVASRIAMRREIPYILRPAGMLSAFSWNHKGWKKRLYWSALESTTVRKAAAFHATSEEEREEILAVRSDARVFVIPNGVESSALNQTAETAVLRRACGTAARDLPIVLFLSRLHPKKGIVDRLLPAIAATRTPCFLAIVGPQDPHAPEYEEEVRNAVARFNLHQQVALLGKVTGKQRWSLYDGASVFILPSHSENFGNVVVEAMARGCPVIVTKEVQVAPLVEQAKAGDVVHGGVMEIAASLDRLLGDQSRRMEAGENGRKFVCDKLQWPAIAERIRAMYSELAIPR
jgi:glycosyltransferase involved in cell wall biosynthesis